MARKNVVVTQLYSNPLNPTVPFSLSSAFTTPITVVRDLDNCSYQINTATTDSTGSFLVEVSNDYYVNPAADGTVTNPGSWSSLTLAGGTPSVNAVNDTIVINLNQLPFYAVRLRYAPNVPGTGTATVFITHKQIGG
jgi:hypothetical protein